MDDTKFSCSCANIGIIVESVAENSVSLKNKIEREVLDEIIESLGNGSLTVGEAQQIARETIATIDAVERHEKTIVDFYKGLSERHKQFEILYTKAKGDILRAHEETALKDALAAIEAGNVDNAHKIAQGAIEKTADETDIDK